MKQHLDNINKQQTSSIWLKVKSQKSRNPEENISISQWGRITEYLCPKDPGFLPDSSRFDGRNIPFPQ